MVIKSASKIAHLRTAGKLLSQKLSPQLLAEEEGIDKLSQLVRSYFNLDGHHIQYNVISAATLAEPKKISEKHRDLIVRIAGYSDYFVDLSDELQDEIIR
jgi:pyruvate-formate lyase